MKPREKNRYPGNCVECHVYVEAEEGRLYRYSGANLNARKMKRGRGKRYAYGVRCEPCYVKHDRLDTNQAQFEHSGITYTGYGQNTHAPSGN